MRTIIAGSRSLCHPGYLRLALNDCEWRDRITEVVCGMAKGADMLGFDWATEQGIPIKRFFPDWDRYGKRAGLIRNREMGDYADALIALWDGDSTGTTHMISYMRHLGKPYVIRQFHSSGSLPLPSQSQAFWRPTHTMTPIAVEFEPYGLKRPQDGKVYHTPHPAP